MKKHLLPDTHSVICSQVFCIFTSAFKKLFLVAFLHLCLKYCCTTICQANFLAEKVFKPNEQSWRMCSIFFRGWWVLLAPPQSSWRAKKLRIYCIYPASSTQIVRVYHNLVNSDKLVWKFETLLSKIMKILVINFSKLQTAFLKFWVSISWVDLTCNSWNIVLVRPM